MTRNESPLDSALYALSAGDGTEQWRFETDGSAGTPTVVDDTVYALSATGARQCVRTVSDGRGGGVDIWGDVAGGGSGSEDERELSRHVITSQHVIIPIEDYAGETVEVQGGGDYLFTAIVPVSKFELGTRIH